MSRYAALDTSFILALAGGESDAEATIDYLSRNGFTPIITESVFEQLGELQQDKNGPAYAVAHYASIWWPTWGIVDPPNPHVKNGTSCVLAEKLLQSGLIPEGTILEAEILLEASCLSCELLITFSDALLKADQVQLNLSLIESDLSKVTVTIASPTTIAARLNAKA